MASNLNVVNRVFRAVSFVFNNNPWSCEVLLYTVNKDAFVEVIPEHVSKQSRPIQHHISAIPVLGREDDVSLLRQ